MNLVLTEAEATRAAGASDPAAWTRAIELWEGRARVFEPAYARYRRAEALLAVGGQRAEAADDLRRAMASAVTLGAQPLQRLVMELAARARIALDDASGRDVRRGRTRGWPSIAADTARARGPRAARRGSHQPPDRRRAVHQREHRWRPRVQHPGQARGDGPHGGGRGRVPRGPGPRRARAARLTAP